MKSSKPVFLTLFWCAAFALGVLIPLACTNTSSNFNPTYPTTPIVPSATATNIGGLTSTPTFTIGITNTPTGTPTSAPTLVYKTQIASPSVPNGIALDNPASPVSFYVAGGDGTLSIYPVGGGTRTTVNQYGVTLFSDLSAVAVSSAGTTCFLLDQSNNAVYVFDYSLNPITSWSAFGTTNFDSPQGIAVNSAGTTVYVADTGHNIVDVFGLSGTTVTSVTQWSGTGSVNFSDPTGITINSAGTTIYVADTGNGVVDEFDPTGYFLGQFSMLPGTDIDTGLSIDPSGIVYAADYNNSLVEEYKSTASPVTLNGEWNGSNISPAPASSFGPDAVAVNSAATTLYVADYDNNAIYAVKP